MHHRSRTKTSAAICLGAALLLAGCAIKVPGLKLATSTSASKQNSRQDRAAPPAREGTDTARPNRTTASRSARRSTPGAAAQPASPYASMSDEEIAKLAIRGILGELHQVESVDGRIAKGKFAFAYKRDLGLFSSRVSRIARQHAPVAGRGLEIGVIYRRCVEERRFAQEPAAAIAKACDHKKNASSYSGFDMLEPKVAWRFGKPIASAIYLDILARAVSDKKFVDQARARFVATLGHEREVFTYLLNDRYNRETRGVRLLARPMNQWSRRTVGYAMTCARQHGVDPAIVARLAAAYRAAPKYKCIWYPAVLERPYLGGGRYGAVRMSNLGARPDVAGSGGDIDCAKAKRVRSASKAVRAVKKDAKQPKEVIAVEMPGRFRWEVMRRYGRPTRMLRIVRVYKRVEF